MLMICLSCKGNVESSTTTYMSDYNGFYIIVKNVPCEKCTQCDEDYLTGETLQSIENIIKQIREMPTKIAVVDYQKTD